MQLFAVNFIPLPGSLYMFRAFYTPIIKSTILTVSTASSTNHSIVSVTFFRRGLVLTSGIMHPRCCRQVAGNIVDALYHKL